MTKPYIPPQEILDKYAEVLVNFAVAGGKGIKKDEVILLEVPECAKPILIPLQKAVLKAGAHYITHFLADKTARHFYELAEDHQLEFFPEKLIKGRVDQMDHSLHIIAEADKKELEGIDPKKIMRRSKAFRPYKDWREEKENKGKYSWVLSLYGTAEMAREAKMSEKKYWDQIIRACYLDEKDPIEKWKQTFKEIDRIKNKLDSLKIQKIHVKSENIDLEIGLGKNRKWLGCDGRNIPSFEVFISPDWRKTNGKISFDQPLYRYDNLISGISLEFKEGIITKFSAKEGENVLKEMIESDEGSNKIGEFSLTDSSFSKINKFMAETLFDENFGGKYGNMHIAVGSSFKDAYPHAEEIPNIPKEKWDEMGFNESIVHSDLVNAEKKAVYAFLEDGKKVLIYKNGKFLI
ncbi:Thermophilic metalloprotease (M29) [uncultured archaeon]|nr:Thermophilic metalloprotease (M29) [uncultured archaeon]